MSLMGKINIKYVMNRDTYISIKDKVLFKKVELVMSIIILCVFAYLAYDIHKQTKINHNSNTISCSKK